MTVAAGGNVHLEFMFGTCVPAVTLPCAALVWPRAQRHPECTARMTSPASADDLGSVPPTTAKHHPTDELEEKNNFFLTSD